MTTTNIQYNMGLDVLTKYVNCRDYFGVIVNNYTFISVPYAFGFDYANGNSDNRQRLDECISEVSKILIKMGFTEVTTTKDATAVKAKKFDTNGDIEKYWKVRIFRDTFEVPTSKETQMSKLERTESTSEPFPMPKLERTESTSEPFPMSKLERIESTSEPFPMPKLERTESASEPFQMSKIERTESTSEPSPMPKQPFGLQRQTTSSGPPFQMSKLERTESTSEPSPMPKQPFGLQRQTTSSGPPFPMSKLERTESASEPFPMPKQPLSGVMKHSSVTSDGEKPVWNQKTVAFDDSATKQPIKYDGEPHGLVLNVWKLTGDGFEFYDMFESFKKEIENWK